MQGQLITLETGLACNNRCAFCPQPPLRACGHGFRDPDTDEMLRRVDQARSAGHDQLAFSGGEPTLRKDLPDLVTHARSAGFTRVSVTTNGRMLSYPQYAQRLLEAGLTGVSVSLHGPDEAVHDALTGVPGSFRQAVAGLARIASLVAGRPGRFDLNTITVLVPGNADRLRETLELAGGLGATLHVVQPFILSRETVGIGERFLLDRDAIVAALRAALSTPLPRGGRVKPYNLAPCLLADLGPSVEVQDYGLKTFRMHQRDLVPGGRREVSGQFWRDARCEGCPVPCPGHRLEHLPRGEAAAWILEDLAAARPPVTGREVILSGTDLLTGEALDTLLGGLRSLGPSRVRLLWGGLGRASADEVLGACVRHGVDEACLVVQPPHVRWPDGGAWLPGNLDAIAEALARFRPGSAPVPSLFLVPAMTLAEDWDFTPDRAVALAEALRAAGGDTVHLAAPEGLDAQGPLHDGAFKAAVAGAFPDLLSRLSAAGLSARLVRVAGVPPDPAGIRLQDRLAALVPVDSWDPAFLSHRLAGPHHGWVSWSHPSWIREDLAAQPAANGL
jgi:pyruvate-formate lyase-activating enzyme